MNLPRIDISINCFPHKTLPVGLRKGWPPSVNMQLYISLLNTIWAAVNQMGTREGVQRLCLEQQKKLAGHEKSGRGKSWKYKHPPALPHRYSTGTKKKRMRMSNLRSFSSTFKESIVLHQRGYRKKGQSPLPFVLIGLRARTLYSTVSAKKRRMEQYLFVGANLASRRVANTRSTNLLSRPTS